MNNIERVTMNDVRVLKRYVWIVVIALFSFGCLPEKYKGDDCRKEVQFVMQDVPYVFIDGEAVEYRPYYTFIEQLDLYLFSDQQINQSSKYNFAYCREHPVISRNMDYNCEEALFVANLYHPRELSWFYREGQLEAEFSIVDNEEPPVLLAAITKLAGDTVPVELRMLVSRLEIRLTNPPGWMVGLDVTVKNIAAAVSTGYSLQDTTHINKQLFFDNQGPGTYSFGINTFPTYSGSAAIVSITPIGTSETSPILVEDGRLHLLPGVVTRLDIVYENDEKITIAIQIDGKWEVVDGGHIII